ncbi:MAG: hypothetical protein ABEK84_03395 [Salinibacter sp.]
MTHSISAAIHIQGPTIRYAEVLREDASSTLRGVGREAFEFDVTRALWDEEGSPDVLERAGAAVREALTRDDDGENASSVRMVVPPLDAFSFFTPVASGLSERERRHYATHQAALVTGTRSPEALRLSLRAVRTVEREGETIEWIHVLAVPQAVAERMETVLAALPGENETWLVSTEASARLMGRAETAASEDAEESTPYSLAIGGYPSHTEYVLTREGTLYHAHTAQEARTPENRAFYGAGFLNRVGVPPSAIGRLFIYGPTMGPKAEEVFETIFECVAVPLDPFEALGRASPPDGSSSDDPPGSYVPCVGGALEEPD